MSRAGQTALLLAAVVAAATARAAPPSGADKAAAAEAADLDALYRHLHAHPELSLHETATAARLAGELRTAGFEVTAGVGGTGVVAVLRNGKGPTVLWRSDMDALPVKEETGLPYASAVVTRDDAGRDVPVMHACGHDVHMTVLVGLARALAGRRDRWSGTAVLIGQPAEERVAGARAMLDDGLLTRFPRPEYILALHVKDDLQAGRVGWRSGPLLAAVDSVDITIHGRGGHGAAPHTTVDPVVIAARLVLGLQTVVSREINPTEAAVITVGSIHAGTKHNIIPERADLQLTVRSYDEATRERLLQGIRRNARAEAEAAGAPQPPDIRVGESTPATVNDAALTGRVVQALQTALGGDRVVEVPPIMGSEDFAYFGRAGIPSCMLWLGVVAPERLEESRAPAGRPLPSAHSSRFAPDHVRAIPTGVQAALHVFLDLAGIPARGAAAPAAPPGR